MSPLQIRWLAIAFLIVCSGLSQAEEHRKPSLQVRAEDCLITALDGHYAKIKSASGTLDHDLRPPTK